MSEVKSPTFQLIREIYETDNAYEHFIAELDKALISKVDYIIIEPAKLGDETARWIMVGNCLHKTAALSGLASIVSGLAWPQIIALPGSFCVISLFCTGLYAISWNPDPCVSYQIEKNLKKLSKIPSFSQFASPVVLKYHSNTKFKYLHRTITAMAVGYCAYQLYEAFK